MSAASKVVTPAPMEGHGAYNRNSRVQATVALDWGHEAHWMTAQPENQRRDGQTIPTSYGWWYRP